MAYTKTEWVNDSKPAINAANLNKIEQGIADAHAIVAEPGPKGDRAIKVTLAPLELRAILAKRVKLGQRARKAIRAILASLLKSSGMRSLPVSTR